MTGRDLVAQSLRLLGALATGETLSASEATDGLAALNQLLDSWSTEEMIIPNIVREVFPLAANTQTYTMGPGGTFSTPRPIRIVNAELQILSASPVIEYPIRILTEAEYARIVLKGFQSTLAWELYDDGAFPLRSLTLWPVPAAGNNLVLYSEKPLANLALTDTISLPPGYFRALRYNLAVDLAPEYGKEASQTIAAIAVESKATIKRANFTPTYLALDPALQVMGHRGAWGGSSPFALLGGVVDPGEAIDGGTVP